MRADGWESGSRATHCYARGSDSVSTTEDETLVCLGARLCGGCNFALMQLCGWFPRAVKAASGEQSRNDSQRRKTALLP